MTQSLHRHAKQLSLRQRLQLLWERIRCFPLWRNWPVSVDGIPVGTLAHAPAFLPIEGHSITIGAPGEGKFTSVIAPLALHDVRDDAGRSCGMVFLDVKNGEAARVTRNCREHMREEMTFVLDPYDLAGGRDTINPFDFIEPQAKDFFEQCAGLAKALIVQRPKDRRGNDFIWDARGAEWLTAVIGYLALAPEEERSIMRVRQIFSLDADGLASFLERMAGQAGAPAFVANMARDISRVVTKAEREASGYIATIMEATQFADSGLIAATLERSSFDPMVVRSHGATIYIVSPGEYLQTSAPWVRLISEVIRQRILRSPQRRQVHWVIDEAKAFDAWNFIEDGLRALRSANISLHLFYQNVGQLKSVWGEGWSSLTDVKLIRFLGSSDVETCKWISELAGETTVVEYSRADNRGKSRSHARASTSNRSHARGRSVADASSWSAQQGSSESEATSRSRGVSEGASRQISVGSSRSTAIGSTFTTGRSQHVGIANSIQFGYSDGVSNSMSAGYSTGPGGTTGNSSGSFGSSHTESVSYGTTISSGESSSSSHASTRTGTEGETHSKSDGTSRNLSTTQTSGVTKAKNTSTGQGGSSTKTQNYSDTESTGRSQTDTEGASEGVTITQTERRRLLTVDEVRRLDKNKMIVFVDRQAAHLIERMHYFRTGPLLARVLEGDLAHEMRQQSESI